jgi:hypothetical protein
MLIQQAAPCLHRKRWREQLGEELASMLEKQGFFENQGRAEWYPCGGFCGGQNQRRVLDTPEPEGGWAAVCGDDEQSCADLVLSSEDLEMQAISPTALASWLREALGARGTTTRFGQRKGVEGLGSLLWEGEEREALLALGCGRAGLRQLLQERERLRARSVVFIPSLAVLDGELQARYAPGSQVEVVDLRHLVSVEAGRLVLVPARSGPRRVLEVREPAGAQYATEPIVAEVCESTGKRGLSAAAYEALVGQRSSFDLFIDMTTPGTKRGGPVRVRDEQGQSTEVELAAREVAVLVELVQARRPMRVGEFRTADARSLDKLLERARRKIEGEGRRGKWRFFHTLSGVEPSAKSFLFKPQEGLSFAVILPLASP